MTCVKKPSSRGFEFAYISLGGALICSCRSTGFPPPTLRFATSSDPVHIPLDNLSFLILDALPLEANTTAVKKEEAMNRQGLILRTECPFYFLADLRGMPEDHLPSTPYKTDDGNAGKVLKIIGKTEKENHIGDQTPELDERNDKSENTPQRKECENRPERVLSRDAKDVVETNMYPEVEMPHDQGSADILGGFDGDYGFESFDLPEASPGETVLSPPLPSKGSVRGHKRVSFRSPGGEKGSSRRNSRQMSAGRNSPSSRMHSAGVTLKESVVPVYNGRRHSGMLNEISKDSMNVTPLTIFALARSRRENTETKRGRFADEHLRQKNETTEASRLRPKATDQDSFAHSYDDNSRLVDKGELDGPAKCFETAALSRPSSVKKSESSLMRWCMRALKKAEREVLFPPKPTRPKSSPSSVNSGAAKKERGVFLLILMPLVKIMKSAFDSPSEKKLYDDFF